MRAPPVALSAAPAADAPVDSAGDEAAESRQHRKLARPIALPRAPAPRLAARQDLPDRRRGSARRRGLVHLAVLGAFGALRDAAGGAAVAPLRAPVPDRGRRPPAAGERR